MASTKQFSTQLQRSPYTQYFFNTNPLASANNFDNELDRYYSGHLSLKQILSYAVDHQQFIQPIPTLNRLLDEINQQETYSPDLIIQMIAFKSIFDKNVNHTKLLLKAFEMISEKPHYFTLYQIASLCISLLQHKQSFIITLENKSLLFEALETIILADGFAERLS